jgi:hypothetical protein
MLQVSNKNQHMGLLRFIRFVHGLEHATKTAKDRPMFLISDYNLRQAEPPSAAK